MKNMNIKKIIKNISLSIMATIGLIKQYEITSTGNISNNIFNILILIFVYNLYKKIKNTSKKEKIFSITLSLIISLIQIIGAQLDNYGEILWGINTLIKILLLIPLLYPIIIYSNNTINKIKSKEEIIITNKTKIKTYIIIFAFNIAVLLAVYPGIYGYDAGFQILEFSSNKVQLTSHFSIIFSFILTQCINIGKIVFKSYQTGLALFSIIQIIFMTYIATRITIFSTKKTKNKYILVLSIIFFSLFPLYTIMVVSTAQDTIFGGLFALLIINLIDLQETEKNTKNMIKIALITFLLCTIRNNGYYAILFTIICTFIFIKNKRIIYSLPLLIGIIIYKIYCGPFFSYIKVYKEPAIKEISSIPSQQLARVYNYNYKILTEETLNEYNRFYNNIDNFKYYTYRQSISDPIKSILNENETKNNIKEYITFWIKVGLKDPKNYIEAFLMNNLGIWYPNKNYNDDRMYHPYIEYNMLDAKKWNKDYIEIERNSKFSLYEKILKITIEKNAWKKIPIISSLFTTGTYFILYIYTTVTCIIQKKKKYLIPLSCMCGLYITLFLAPVSLFRYCFPIVILMPVMISMIIEKEKN